MPSTPLICCSIGATTVSATVSALAPGYCPDTLMVGGAISGYCATGKREYATPPRMMITIAITEAKIGRSMKKCEIFMARSVLGLRRSSGRLRALLLRRDLGVGPDAREAVHDDLVVGRKPVLDDAQIPGKLAKRDVFLLRHVVVADDHHVFAHLLARDRHIRHQQRLVGHRARHAHAREHSGREQAFRIGDLRAAADRAARAVDHVVDEVDGALVDKIRLVDQPTG